MEREKRDCLNKNVPGVKSFLDATESENHDYLQVGEDKEDEFIAVNDEFTKDVEYVGEDYSNICQAGQSQQDVEKSAIELLASRILCSSLGSRDLRVDATLNKLKLVRLISQLEMKSIYRPGAEKETTEKKISTWSC